ncbi:ROK family transcriptional regulator [Paracoccus spongiarum]|uniref:ROK family transcriptional regulator n=1 Tax=Paracoccus spongiarum TaxID=3064387 RepID=A0ABT9JDB4_9RHOB|nr:ROK family transcriptional regulator [Paracoccus sp. 2205BS29-5]MDP5307823.1 ROK family transcriptional regulator [Paracoccus sp. 2205BS29-5]
MPDDRSDRLDAGDLSRNERQILGMVRRRGPMPRAALAQACGVSAQAITKLTRKLISLGYLQESEVVRGKVGQPSTPLALNPEGARFLGLKLGRRLVELALVDFAGQVRLHRQEVYGFPDPDRVIAFARQGISTFLTNTPSAVRDRIRGLGIATPYRLWDWGTEMRIWHDRDLRGELARDLPFPVFLDNDATTACGAELMFGQHRLPPDFLHVYIAHFCGGGIVLDGRLRHGPTRNAGALGSMPLAGGAQLLDRASVSSLEQRLGRSLPPDDIGWDVPDATEAVWVNDAAEALAFAAMSAVALVDLPLVVIDGAVPPGTRTRLADATRRAIAAMPSAGLDRPQVVEGSLGRHARVLGAAALPLSHFFELDGELG